MIKQCNILCVSVICFISSAAFGESTAIPAKITPFKVSYDIKLSGLDAGKSIVEVSVDDNLVSYALSISPRGIVAMLFGDTIHINAHMRLEKGRLLAKEYIKKHQRKQSKDQHYRFDADGLSVETLHKEHIDFLDIPKGTLDEASAQLQLILDAQTHNAVWHHTVVADGKLKHYQFSRVGTERIVTTFGDIETIKIARAKVRDKQVSEIDHFYWLSPAHHYLPIRVDRIKKGKVKRTMIAKTIDFN